jgi:anti-anti-sigma regulatory factor
VWDEERLSADVRPGHPTVLTMRGEVDLTDVERLRELLLLAFAADHVVFVDVSRATLVDGAVMDVLARADARAPFGLRVRGAKGTVAKMFCLADLEHLLVADA